VDVVDTEEELVRRLEPSRRGDVILVKASRVVGLEALVDALVQALAD
jgi:UDP-N-acetylmuramyl pentapeptide synthase